MLELKHVTFAYPLRRPVLRDFSLCVQAGERLWLSGASGCGKTTLLRLLLGLERPRHGTLLRSDGLRVSAVFQEDRLLPGRTVLENAALFGDETLARELLSRLGLGDALDAYPAQLSGGMARRAALGRALAHPFDLLVLDEPFTGLDNASRELCLSVIDAQCGNKTMLLATHDEWEAAALRARRITL